MKAAIYSRKSKFTGKGESIENQVQLCTEHAKNIGISDFLIYEDEGFSGGNTDRPKFQEMLKDAKSKKFDTLICYRLDRISRNIGDFAGLIDELQQYNIGFISIREQFDTSTPMGRAMMYIASVFAQLERETIAERIRDNMMELAKGGRWLGGQTPLGFGSEPITYFDDEMNERSMCKLSPITEELNQVKLIYDKYLEVGSISLTLKYLLSSNIKGKNGGDYAAMSIRDILRNPVYVKSNEEVFEYLDAQGMNVCGEPNDNGILIYNKRNSKYVSKDVKEWIAAVSKHKGIIDSTKWLEVQKRLDINKAKESPRTGTSKKSLLSGVLKCAICGSPMRISYGRQKQDGSDRIYYYSCTLKGHSGKTRCDNPNVRGDELEQSVIENIKHLNTDTILKELEGFKKNLNASETGSAIKNIQNDIEVKNKQVNTLLDKLSQTEHSTTSGFILSKVETLGKEIKELKSKLKNAQSEKHENFTKELNADMVLEVIKEFNSCFENNEDIVKKRFLLETIVDKIYWDGNTGEVDIKLWGSKKNRLQTS